MLRSQARPSDPPVILAILVAVCAVVHVPPAWGQANTGSALAARLDGTFTAIPVGPDAAALESDALAPNLSSFPQADDDSQFANAVLGSTLGAVVGGVLGGLIIAAAADTENRRTFRNDENFPEGAALLLIAGGPPTGAVLYTDIPRDHSGSYMMGMIGELVLGGGGVALGVVLGGDSQNGQLAGALSLGIPGVVLGAAGGAVLGAPDRPSPTGALTYADGDWTVSSPTVRPGVHLQPEPGLYGRVSLVTVDL